jgi:hypothetical protein
MAEVGASFAAFNFGTSRASDLVKNPRLTAVGMLFFVSESSHVSLVACGKPLPDSTNRCPIVASKADAK